MTGQYSVGIVGLGQVGVTYGSPDEPYPYCHAGGAIRCGRTRLAAVVDRNPAAIKRFAGTWGQAAPSVRAYASVTAMLDDDVPDIVAVCIPEPSRHGDLDSIIDAAPRAIFLEKPTSCSLAEMDRMVARASERGTLLTVSYSRHWTPHVVGLQKLVADGLIGRLRSVVAYSPGERLLSYACHTVDLVCQFAGYRPLVVTAVGDSDANRDGSVPPGYQPEPSYERIMIVFDNGVSGVIHGKAGPHEYWYADLIGTDGTVRAGQYVDPAAFRPDGTSIELAPGALPPNASVFAEAYTQIAAAVDGGPVPACAADDAAVVNEICFAAVESILAGERVWLPVRRRDLRVYANG